MKQNSCREVHSFSAIQEIPSILRNQKVHFRVQNRSPLVPILNQLNLVRTHPSNLFKIYFNIILPSTPTSSEWSFPSGFWTQTLYANIYFSLTCQFHSYI